MATIGRLVTETQKAFKRPVRLWLTELGYQSNPPDRLLGVAPAVQASYIAAAAYKAWATPRVDLLIQYLYRDEPGLDRWQSGLETTAGTPKPALGGCQGAARRGEPQGHDDDLWGRSGPGRGARAYRCSAARPPAGDLSAASSARGPTERCNARRRGGAGMKLRLLAGGEPGNKLVVR